MAFGTTTQRAARFVSASKQKRAPSNRNTNVHSTRKEVPNAHAAVSGVIKSNLKGPYNAV